MKKLLIHLCLLLASQLLIAQTGPAGIGSNAENLLWIKADAFTGYSDGASIDTLFDQSGNGNHLIQNTYNNQPLYRLSGINGRPSIEFDGSNDFLEDSDGELIINGNAGFTLFAIIQSDATNTDAGFLETETPDGQDDLLCFRYDASGVNGGGSNVMKFGINTTSGQAQYEASNNSQTTDPQMLSFDWSSGSALRLFINGSSDTPTDGSSSLSGTLSGSDRIILGRGPKDGSDAWGGDIAELIYFNSRLNTAQRTIIDNYLSTKYSISIINDLYTYDITHGNDLAGIGREDASNEHDEAYSSDILRISNPDDMSDGEYLLFGHDSASVNSWTTSEAPNAGSNTQRLAREWRISETGDLGNVVLAIDTTDLPAKPLGYTKYVVWTDADGNFANGASAQILTLNGGVYESAPVNISNGNYIAIGTIRPVVQFSTGSSTVFEYDLTDSIELSLNYPLPEDVTVPFSVTGGTASGGGTDYTLSGSSVTISSGNTSAYITPSIVNDTVIESSENFTIEVSSPSGASLGSNTTHTVTIADDDNPRKIEFQSLSSQASESSTSASITIRLDSIDLVNPTRVDYAVTGGDATGGGVDYTLANGTATILAGDSTTSFNITIEEDALNEIDEEVIITLSNPTNSNLDTNTEHIFRIMDNDAAPAVQFATTTTTIEEDAGILIVYVDLSAVSGQDVTVDYTVNDITATNGSDFFLSNGIFTIPEGETVDSLEVIINNDAIIELAESFSISLSNPTNADLGSNTTHEVTISASDQIGYQGPGGVGDDETNVLWLDASAVTGLSNGAAVTTLIDQSGNGNDFSQASSGNRPVYRSSGINGKPSIDFDGNNDYLEDTDAANYLNGLGGFTIFAVVQSDDTNTDNGVFDTENPDGGDDRLALRYDAGGINGGGNNVIKYGLTTTDDQEATETANNIQTTSAQLLTLDWLSSESARLFIDGTLDVPTSGGGSISGNLTDATTFLLGRGPKDASAGWDGDIAEFIVFSNRLNTTQRILIENYLAAKYGITIASDQYAYEGMHDNGVIGIGQEASNDFHVSAQSDDMLTINNPSDIDDNEYLMIGHDNGSVVSHTSTESPTGIVERLSREWRVSETGDLGTITITLDTTGLPAPSPGHTARVLMIDEDGDFSEGARIYYLPYKSGAEYELTGVEVSDGDYLTFATAENIATVTGSFNTASNWSANSVPGTGETALLGSGTTINLSSTTTVGDIIIASQATLDLSGNQLNLDQGTIVNDGTFNANGGTVNYSASGDQLIADVVYNHLRIEGTGDKTLFSDLLVSGNLILNAATLDLDNTGNYTLQVAGNWVNNGGSLEPRNGRVDLNGSGSQSITTNGQAFYDLRVSGSGPYNLMDDLELSNQLLLEGGIVSTSSNELFVNNTSGSAIPSYSNTSFVNGNLKRGVGFGIFDYIFPVGNGLSSTNYHPAEVSPDMLVGVSTVTAYFTDLVRHDDVDLSATDSWLTYESISPDGMWVISPNQQPTGGVYSVRLYLDNMTGLQDNQFGVIKRSEGASGASEWQALGNLNAMNGLGRLLSDGYALRTGLTSFSEFGVGSGTDSGDPLPIELLYFNAEKNGAQVDLNWATATEINNDYFTIERSEDGRNFEIIKTVEGAGNSTTTLEYHAFDKNPFKGTSYYRLKQTDYDGQFEYSDAVAVQFGKDKSSLNVNAYPNPIRGSQLQVNIKSDNTTQYSGEISIQLHDIKGKMVVAQIYNAGEGRYALDLPQNLTKGIYLLSVNMNGELYRMKLIH